VWPVKKESTGLGTRDNAELLKVSSRTSTIVAVMECIYNKCTVRSGWEKASRFFGFFSCCTVLSWLVDASGL
jgi:hypothetical protein